MAKRGSTIKSNRTQLPYLVAVAVLVVLIFFSLVRPVGGQYAEDTKKYAQVMARNTETLVEALERHPDVNVLYNPMSIYNNTNFYIFSYPTSTEYVLGINFDPCRGNSYDCCMNVFGTAEYPALLKPNLQSERVYKYIVIGQPDEVQKNYYLVDELGSSISTTNSRSPDDYKVWNDTCTGIDTPYSYCAGRNFAYQRSPVRPACEDNNSSVDALAGCYSPLTGEYQTYCVQVAYSSNTFIPQCGVNTDGNCGTYLEVHMAHGTPYHEEREIISQVQLTTRNVTGYYTTMLPLTWKGNSSKVLCQYSETFLRVGSLVYIKSSAPVCCCPPPYSSDTGTGSFQCPVGSTSNGAFAYRPYGIYDTLLVDTLVQAYPYCPIDLSANEDRMMCSVYDVENRRDYTRTCANVTHFLPTVTRGWKSVDMLGLYDGVCPYYKSCALTLDSGKCRFTDLRFTFIGQVGIVTAVDNDATIPTVMVSFNNNRTSYEFSQEDVELEQYKAQYELWWVVRSPAMNTVQKRKGFNITNPRCTFDSVNNRYFPYAILDAEGKAIDTSALSYEY